jgi:hypothetical protein
VQVKNKPCVEFIIVMHLISWIPSRGSETNIIENWFFHHCLHFHVQKLKWIRLINLQTKHIHPGINYPRGLITLSPKRDYNIYTISPPLPRFNADFADNFQKR